MKVMKVPPKFDVLSWEIGRIYTHVLLVKAGVRSVALEMVSNEHVEDCLKIIKNENLQYMLNPRGETHTSVYLFKHSCMKNVINFTLGNPHKKTALIQWIAGKMFGYGESEIDRFIALKKAGGGA